jgi:hypothetical protein
MRTLFTWFALLGIMVGLQGRVLGLDPCEVLESLHHPECGGHSHSDHGHPDDSSHDKQCPQEHHHHVACSHSLPSSADFDGSCRLSPPSSFFQGVSHESEKAPDGPSLSEDKPPLI